MTAIAWAITFIGLMFYGSIWDDKLKSLNLNEGVERFQIISFVMLIFCTMGELIKK